ncbi:hypothetical protein I4U23_023387 [Adineta vaga]|nr:hypothetical protein I4U23_023387 [Adineta vaga]
MATESSTENNDNKTLIVLASPSIKDSYYSTKFKEIIEYMINFAKLVQGKDQLVILVNPNTFSYFEEKIDSNQLIKAYIDDIWIRDVSPAIPDKQIKFKYSPSYLSSSFSSQCDKSFHKWIKQNDIQYNEISDIILDGGNIVDNPAGTRVIITEHILQSNPLLTKTTAKEKLKQILGVSEIAIIKEVPDDTTGHADGMVMWATDDRLLYMKLEEPLHSEIMNELKTSFPNVEIIELPNYYVRETWRNFVTARHVYVNSIVTDKYIYMPTFDSIHDIEMLNLFQSLTDKTVVGVPAESVCMMGGSVRCLSWQAKGLNKKKILQRIKP